MAIIDQNRNFGLDIIRALSIGLVVYSHNGRYFLQESGIIGVEFFFVLSGFLIGQILFRSFASKEQLHYSDLFRFWKKRWWRTLPLYYFVILVKFCATGFTIGWNILFYIFFLQNHFYGISFMGVTWSLVIEEWFYILVPVLLFVLHSRKVAVKKILLVLLGFCAALIVLKLYMVFARHIPLTGIRPSVPLRLDSLCLGVILAYIKSAYSLHYKKLCHPAWALAALGAIVMLALLISGAGDQSSIADRNPFVKALWFPAFSCCVAFMVPFVESSRLVNVHLKRIRPLFLTLTLISILTYSIYLTHLFSLGVCHTWLGTAGDYALVQYSVIVLVAFVVYVCFEHPMTQLRDRTFFKKKQAVQ